MSGRYRLYALIVLPLISATATQADEPAGASVKEVQRAVEKGLFFVEKTTMNWWEKKKCVSCHEGPALMFSHNIARRQGFNVPLEKLEFWTDRWILVGGLVNKRKDGRMDAGGMLGAPLTMAFRDTASDLDQARAEKFGKLMQIAINDWHQEDGNWDIKVGLDYQPWIALALESFEASKWPISDEVRSEIAERGKRTEAWMLNTEHPMPEKTEDIAAWLVYEHHRGRSDRVSEFVDELKKRQRDDGLWGITVESETGHQLVTGAVLFALTSIGRDTSDPLVAQVQRLLLDLQQKDGRWKEGGRIFDDGSEPENIVYNNWTTAVVCAGLSQTIRLPAGTEPLFVPGVKQRAYVDEVTQQAAEAYKGGDYGDSAEDPT